MPTFLGSTPHVDMSGKDQNPTPFKSAPDSGVMDYGHTMTSELSQAIAAGQLPEPLTADYEADSLIRLGGMWGLQNADSAKLVAVGKAFAFSGEEIRGMLKESALMVERGTHGRDGLSAEENAKYSPTAPLSDVEYQEYADVAVEGWGGNHEAMGKDVAAARAYVEHMIQPTTLAEFDKSPLGKSALVFCRPIIQSFATRARVLGLVSE